MRGGEEIQNNSFCRGTLRLMVVQLSCGLWNVFCCGCKGWLLLHPIKTTETMASFQQFCLIKCGANDS